MSQAELDEVDLLVVGDGKAGKSLAMDRAKAGWSVVMVERDKIGGTCINVACIPTKSLVGSARTLLTVRHAETMGIEVAGDPAVSLEGLRHHKESVVGGMVEAHRKMFTDSGMDFIMGTARFVAPRTVQVATNDGGTRLVRGRDVVINTGTTPAAPDLPGIAEADVWTSETILRLDRLPQTLLILGGGYVGCEFASMFALFGSRVVLVQSGPQLLAKEDADIAGAVADILTRQGVELHLGSRATAVRREPDHGAVTVSLDDGSSLTGDELLVATGRSPVPPTSAWTPHRSSSPTEATSRSTITCAPAPSTSGLPATSPAARSSPTPRGTTSGSCVPTCPAVTPPPPAGSCPTPSSSPRSWPGSA